MMIRKRRRDHDGRRIDDALRQILGEREVVLELQMRSVLFAGRTEGNDDDGVRREEPFGIGPREIAQPPAGFRRLYLGENGGRGTEQRCKR